MRVAGWCNCRARRRCKLRLFGAIVAAVAACRESADEAPRFSHDANRACFAASESDRWSPQVPRRLTTVQVDPDAGFTSGIAGSDAWLFLFDQRLGRIVVADSLYREVGAFARPGHGPGEILPLLAPSQLTPKGHRVDWIDVSGDTVSVLDGLTIHWYRPDGTHIRDSRRGLARVAQGAVLPFSTRLRRFGSRDLVDIESPGLKHGDGPAPPMQREFSIWSVGDADAEMVFRLAMASLPLKRDGASAHPFSGVDEAQALWDLHGECLVVSDGGSPRLYVLRLGSNEVDTLAISLPSAITRNTGEQEELMRRMGSSGRIPDPAVRKRVRRLAIDPDGWAWIEPNHRDPALTGDRGVACSSRVRPHPPGDGAGVPGRLSAGWEPRRRSADA
jgi:hypothetical protein